LNGFSDPRLHKGPIVTGYGTGNHRLGDNFVVLDESFANKGFRHGFMVSGDGLFQFGSFVVSL
jgi:hypothetical protein